ncbi:MAG: hypothetical protein HOQ24_19545 [Mycobacteriaceae bacterium]|nr:hypothetical protein [Mycobacteriaceae bacterium]
MDDMNGTRDRIASGAWQLTADDLTLLWHGAVLRPFLITRAGSADCDSQGARSRLRERLGGRFDRLFSALNRPDQRIMVNGWDLRQPDDPQGRIRTLGVFRGEVAYLLRQLPGRSIAHSGDIVVTEHSSLALARAVVHSLPEVDAGPHVRMLLDSGPEAREFLDTPARRVGTIEFSVRRRIGSGLTSVACTLGWRDLADSGRYVLVNGRPPTATSVDRELLTRVLHALLTAPADPAAFD